MAGYSNTPLIKKLGIKPGSRVYVRQSPVDYATLTGGLPPNAELKSRLGKGLDVVHFFTRSRSELEAFLPKAKQAIMPDGMIWVSWPKKVSKVATDVTEDVVRAVCLPLDLIDVKVCAVDEVWSGLKLVVRKEKR